MPSVPPGRGRSGLRRLGEYQVVPGIQGLPSAARVRASSQPVPWRAAVARQERIAQKVSAPDRDVIEGVIRLPGVMEVRKG